MEKETDNLTALIDQAKASLAKQKPVVREAVPTATRLPVALIAFAVAVFVWGWQYWSSEITTEQIRLDLKTLIAQGRSQIEAQHARSGRLPDQLSDHTLAKLVRYEIVDGNAQPPKYRLIAALNGVSERWATE